jgi:TPR repeat protein
MQKKIDKIKQYLCHQNIPDTLLIEIPESLINIVYDLFFQNIKLSNIPNNKELYYFYGLYYMINNDDTNFEKCMTKSYELGLGHGAYILGKTKMNQKKYEEMEEYYTKAIELGNISAINDMAYYNHYITKNHALAKQYYNEAIEKGNIQAMYNIGYLCHEIGDIDNMLKWWKLATTKGSSQASYSLGVYYENINDKKHMLKYWKIGADMNCYKCMNALKDYYIEDL